ncbi:MAG TPA: hypothetical protein VIV11_16320 [Kofleriaceae bacterium]
MRRVVAVILLATAWQAAADSGAADRAVAEAQTRAAKNDFVGAAAKYREAFKAEPRPDLMCNVGVAYYKAKDLPRAQRYLDQCLSIGTSLDRAFIDKVKTTLTAVEGALSSSNHTPVDLLVQPTSATTAVEGGVPFDEPILGSRRVWFPFGKYRLTVHAEGHVDHVIEVEAKDRNAVAARVALKVAPPPPPIEVGSGSAEGSATIEVGSGSAIEPPSPQPLPPIAKPSLLPPIVATTASAGLGILALGFYLAAVDKANAAGETGDRAVYEELVDQARSRQKMSWLFSGLAGAGAVVSGILWYRYAAAPTVEVQANGTGAAITLSGRW